ncbi:hypothetical protein [Szabonella alba]|uniref:Uncharacterized protein n=1 Tax=Szabonella alba TaxID=2804194 RepID=A0A8K0Y0E3_9RHOB|nr:hypothetical protein [Szabonella alba]MBL4917761.1 hypothetical protein [Szabonella alba]
MTPELKEYLAELQRKAMRLQVLISAMNACLDDETLQDAVVAMVTAAEELATGLNSGLDSVSLPEGVA